MVEAGERTNNVDGMGDGNGFRLVACTPQRDANTVHGTQHQLTTAQH
jgi:hypothetical protein